MTVLTCSCCLGSPLELEGCADKTHDRDTGGFEPVRVFARERGPATSELVARTAAFDADLEHASRHLSADFHWLRATAQESGTDVAE